MKPRKVNTKPLKWPPVRPREPTEPIPHFSQVIHSSYKYCPKGHMYSCSALTAMVAYRDDIPSLLTPCPHCERENYHSRFLTYECEIIKIKRIEAKVNSRPKSRKITVKSDS